MREMRHPLAHRLISGVLSALYPSRCPACSGSTDNHRVAPFCSRCWTTIGRYAGGSCRICSDPFISEYRGVCGNCIKTPPPFSRALTFGIYDKVLAQAIHALKFQRIRRLYRPLGTLMLELDMSDIDALVPVPLSTKGLRERGFNQSLLLSKVVAEATGVPLIIDGLVKGIDTPPQIGLSAKERTANLRGAFTARRSFNNMKVLLVDDVMTTGATARACSKELLRAGAAEVIVHALARASAV